MDLTVKVGPFMAYFMDPVGFAYPVQVTENFTLTFYMVAVLVPVLCMFLMLLICFVFFAKCQWGLLTLRHTDKLQTQKRKDMESLLGSNFNGINYGSSSDHTASVHATDDPRPYIIPFEDMKLQEIISQGTFGIVFKGYIKGKEQPVAIKKLKFDDHDEEFLHEVQMLITADHENIVTFIGVCLYGEFKFIITEFCSGKSLHHFVMNRQKGTELSFELKLKILIDTIRGIQYLHEHDPVITHRDLKPQNILVSV
jgi:hypothetical protein